MEKNKCLECIVAIVAEIFERDAASLNAGTRLMQDLPCESIDLLEIAARISREARREVDDDALFLRNVRTLVYEHPQKGRLFMLLPSCAQKACTTVLALKWPRMALLPAHCGQAGFPQDGDKLFSQEGRKNMSSVFLQGVW